MNILWNGGEYANTANEQPSKRVQRLQRENERSNLLGITHLILNFFLDNAIKGNRVLEADTSVLADFNGMLERILWHGLKSPSSLKILTGKSSPAELWVFLGSVAKTDTSMCDAWQSVDALSNLSTPLSRIRALLRLAIMQKKLSDYFRLMLGSSAALDSYYETWSLMRDERCAMLAGAFLALNVFDFNLNIEFSQLNEELTSLDISPYLRLPTLPTHKPQWREDYEREEEDRELAMILDQKHYLEERNRQLTELNHTLQSEIKSLNRDKVPHAVDGVIRDADALCSSLTFTHRLGDLEREKELLQVRLSEKDDAMRLAQLQLHDTKLLNEDLYEKVRQAEGRLKRVTCDLHVLKETRAKELEEVNKSLRSLNLLPSGEKANEPSEASLCSSDPVRALRDELTNKTQQYLAAMTMLDERSQEVHKACEEASQLSGRCSQLEKKASRLEEVEKELSSLRQKHEKTLEQLAACQQALEELGGHLSESKMQILELKEEMVPLCGAEWVEDACVKECRLCEKSFSMTERKHHCRRCGWIFCDACSKGRVRLPSSAGPVRVCLSCYDILKHPRRPRHFSSSSVASTPANLTFPI